MTSCEHNEQAYDTTRTWCEACGAILWQASNVTLPSGSTIDADTWQAMQRAGSWAGWLDPGMYSADDRAFLDRNIGHV